MTTLSTNTKKLLLTTLILAFLQIIFANYILLPIKAVGAVPSDCQNITNTNPKHTRYCNPSCSSSNCIYYCPAYNNGAHIKVTSDFTDLIIKYKAPTHPIYITIPGTSIQNYEVNCSSRICTGEIRDTSHKIFKKGSVLTVIIRDREGYAIGYRLPDSNNNCGETNICSEIGGHYGQLNISDIVTPPSNDTILISKQCYGDSPIGDADFDFNDYAITIFGKPLPVVDKHPSCISLKQSTTNESQQKRSYKFKCSVKGNATGCKFVINNNKIITSKINDKNGCVIDYTFANSGNYNVVCYATNNKEEVTSDQCQQLVHIPTNTAGGILVPILATLTTGIFTFIVLNKKYRNIKVSIKI